MNQPAAKPTMHSMGRSNANTQPRDNNEVIADQIAAILAKRAANEVAANPDTWTAIDAAKIAVQAAQSSKGYWTSVNSAIGDFQTAIDMMGMEIKTLRRKLASAEDQIASSKNTAIVCGIVAAAVSGFAVSLVFAPGNNSPIAPVPTESQIIRSGG